LNAGGSDQECSGRTIVTCAVVIAASLGRVTNKANQAVAFQGYHDEHVLFVLDEAPGIPPEILNAIEGTSASGDGRVLMLGNPTIPSGAFYDALTAN
jgi:hypothetical protein